jgi:hypothetical protein
LQTTSATILGSILLLAGGAVCAQNSLDGPGREAPAELRILNHTFGSDRKFVTEATPTSPNGGEPATRVVTKSTMAVSVKVKSESSRTIAGVSWYFEVERNGEQYFRLPFITPVEIQAGKTKTFKGEIERLPRRPPRTVTVDELKNPVSAPAQEHVVITCILFSDGRVSPLNDAAVADCQRLQSQPEIRKKLQKL